MSKKDANETKLLFPLPDSGDTASDIWRLIIRSNAKMLNLLLQECPDIAPGQKITFSRIRVLTYLALGDTTLPKERCEILGEGSTAVMENFCTTVCSGRLGKRKLKGRQQKGFAEEVQAMVDAVKAGGPAPIPFEEIENVTRATFAVQRALKSGAAELL